MMANRSERAKLGKEIVAILENGFYSPAENPGAKVPIDEQLKCCIEKTNLFGPDDLESFTHEEIPQNDVSTEIEVVEESTLGAGRRLNGAGLYAEGKVACLNFASAKNPGGGFLGGSRAQEESLAMATGLYFSLKAPQVQEYYTQNRPTRGGIYKNYLIYSPGVPVLRDETSNELLAHPYNLNMITMPAPNANAAKKQHSMQEIQETLTFRVDCVLGIIRKFTSDFETSSIQVFVVKGGKSRVLSAAQGSGARARDPCAADKSAGSLCSGQNPAFTSFFDENLDR